MWQPLLRGDCKVPYTLRTVAAIGVKQRTFASRAQTGVDDAVVGQATLAEQGHRQAGYIDVRLAPAAIDIAIGVAIAVLELLGHFLPHFETAEANRGTEPGECSGRIEVRFALQQIESLCRDPPDGSAPTGMNVGDDGVTRIDDRHRQTIGDLDDNSRLLIATPQRIAGVTLPES